MEREVAHPELSRRRPRARTPESMPFRFAEHAKFGADSELTERSSRPADPFQLRDRRQRRTQSPKALTADVLPAHGAYRKRHALSARGDAATATRRSAVPCFDAHDPRRSRRRFRLADGSSRGSARCRGKLRQSRDLAGAGRQERRRPTRAVLADHSLRLSAHRAGKSGRSL